jgi:hypothetical protein
MTLKQLLITIGKSIGNKFILMIMILHMVLTYIHDKLGKYAQYTGINILLTFTSGILVTYGLIMAK